MQFDIFGQSKLDAKNLKATLDTRLKASPQTFFIPDKETYLKPHGRELFMTSIMESHSSADSFARAIIEHKQKNYLQAHRTLTDLLTTGTDSPVLYFNLLRLQLALTGKYPPHTVVNEVQKIIAAMVPRTQTISVLAKLLGHLKRSVT